MRPLSPRRPVPRKAKGSLAAAATFGIPVGLALAAGVLLIFPSLWIVNAAGGDPNLARAIGQVVDPVTLAARAAPAYALPVALGVLLGIGISAAVWAGAHFHLPRSGKWALAGIVAIVAGTFVAFSLPSWLYCLATAAIIAGGYLTVRFNPVTADSGYAPVAVAFVLLAGLLSMSYLAPFPRVTITTYTPSVIYGHLVEFEPAGGAWVLVRTDPDTLERELQFVPASQIDELTYPRP